MWCQIPLLGGRCRQNSNFVKVHWKSLGQEVDESVQSVNSDSSVSRVQETQEQTSVQTGVEGIDSSSWVSKLQEGGLEVNRETVHGEKHSSNMKKTKKRTESH